VSDEFKSTDNPDEELPSKTALKREAQRLQELGRRISGLSSEQFMTLDLSPQLAQAVRDYQRFPSHGAKKRQLQFLGKLLRKTDVSVIEAHLADIEGQSAQSVYEFSQLEQWREALLDNPSSITEFIATYPQVDRQQLRQLVKKANTTKSDTEQKAASRKLFRFLREASTRET
jgi:ribosome-associated protein